MRIFILILCLFDLGMVSATAHSQVNLDLHIGNAPAPAPPPPPPPAGPPPVVLDEPPHMVYDPTLKLYLAVGITYDLFFHNNFYYYQHNGIWYRSPYYRGPCVVTEFRRIPRGLREHRIEELRGYRERAWRDYHGHETEYRGRHFRAREPERRGEREIR